MALNLTIDQGNTAAKMALWDGDRMVDIAIERDLTPAAIERFISAATDVKAALYCSVACHGNDIINGIAHMIPKVIRLSSAIDLPIGIDYGTPGTLGADRIAAAVGAWATYPGQPLLVVDAGTAVTYDYVTADGRFAGGNIAPGMSMRLEALHRFTARLPEVEVPWEIKYDSFLGHDTASAMILGAVYGILGAVTYYRNHLPDGTQVVMTGGWATELSKLCDFDVNVEQHLVSKGLNRILLYNEDK